MNCDELQPLMDAHLDSELDARTTLEIQTHLSACARCAGDFAHAAQFVRHLNSTLRRGDATPDLWAAVERGLAQSAAEGTSPPRIAPRSSRREPGISGPGWRFWLWPSPKAYAALATVWVALCAVEVLSRPAVGAPRSPTMVMATREAPSAAQKLVLAHQQQLRAELLAEPSTPTRPARPNSPQSRRRPATRLQAT